MEEFPPDSELLRRARIGDSRAFAHLCERHRERVWRAARAIAPEEAEDLAQEAILRAWASLKSHREGAPFGAWLTRIALNAAHDYRKSAWNRRVRPLAQASGAADSTPEMETEQRETVRRVRRSVACLPESMRTPLWLHYFEGFTIAEIAALEGSPESTIRSRMKNGLRRLAAALADLVETEDGLSAGLLPERCHT